MREQLLPAAGARIPLRNHGHRLRPGNGELGVVMDHADVLARIVRPVDPVADVRGRRQSLKAMQKPGRYVQLAKVDVIEQKRLLPTESRRIPADVDQHVVHGPVSAAHQLGFASTRPRMHAAHHALRRAGLRVLGERDRPAEVFVEHRGVEGSGEQPALVAEGLRHQHRHVGQVALLDTHTCMLP